jgi:hypothetical protein
MRAGCSDVSGAEIDMRVHLLDKVLTYLVLCSTLSASFQNVSYAGIFSKEFKLKEGGNLFLPKKNKSNSGASGFICKEAPVDDVVSDLFDIDDTIEDLNQISTKELPKFSCDRTGTKGSAALIHFQTEAVQLLEKKRYRKMKWSAVEPQLQAWVKNYKLALDQKEALRHERNVGKTQEISKKVVAAATQAVIVDGPAGTAAGVASYGAEKAIHAGVKAGKWAKDQLIKDSKQATAAEEKETYPMKKLVNRESGNIRDAVHSIAGFGEMILATASIGASSAIPVVGGMPIALAADGLAMTSGHLEKTMSNTKSRARALAKAQSKVSALKSDEAGLEAVPTVSDVGVIATEEVLDSMLTPILESVVGSVSETGFEIGASTVPVAGAFFTFMSGAKKAIEAPMTGTERDKEVIFIHEFYTRKVLKKMIEIRKGQISDLLAEADALIKSSQSTKEKLDILRTVDRLCQALGWLDRFEEKSRKKFLNRITYLGAMIALKNSRVRALDHLRALGRQDRASIEVKKLKNVYNALYNYQGRQEKHLEGLQNTISGIYSSKGQEVPKELKKKLAKLNFKNEPQDEQDIPVNPYTVDVPDLSASDLDGCEFLAALQQDWVDLRRPKKEGHAMAYYDMSRLRLHQINYREKVLKDLVELLELEIDKLKPQGDHFNNFKKHLAFLKNPLNEVSNPFNELKEFERLEFSFRDARQTRKYKEEAERCFKGRESWYSRLEKRVDRVLGTN